MKAATAVESPLVKIPLVHRQRNLMAVEVPAVSATAAAGRRGAQTDAGAKAMQQLDRLRDQFGAEIAVDIQYDLEDSRLGPGQPDILKTVPDASAQASLDDVLDQINARDAWRRTRGGQVVIAIVDTGINGLRPEFAPGRRLGQWAAGGLDAWQDPDGHGTMCACIAAGSRADGGEFDGVAPEADLISCRTSFFSTELMAIYDFLTQQAQTLAKPIIASNSWGVHTGTPPADDDVDLEAAIDDAINAGVHVVFSAGNYHQTAGGRSGDSKPNSIWLYKSRADVMTTAACDLQGQMWDYSSRGPGQRDGQPNSSPKPDVTAPTPKNGRIVYGQSVLTLADGWGTSGAAPQVAALCGLILAVDPALDRARVFDLIRSTAQTLGHDARSQGRGLIDCGAAVAGIP